MEKSIWEEIAEIWNNPEKLSEIEIAQINKEKEEIEEKLKEISCL